MMRKVLLVAAACVVLGAGTLCAQDAVLNHYYGMGVHAFFSGDYTTAFERFTTAIDNGSEDPRCYYFRGLTYLYLGREDEARMDFEKGAELEAADVNGFYNVGRSLQRIQGPERLMLQKYRMEARLAAMQESERIRRERYEQLRREEQRVLQQAAPAEGIPDAAAPSGGAQPAQPPAQPDQPAEPEQPPAPAEEPPQPSPDESATNGDDVVRAGRILGVFGGAAGEAVPEIEVPGAGAQPPQPPMPPADNGNPFAPESSTPSEPPAPADNGNPFST